MMAFGSKCIVRCSFGVAQAVLVVLVGFGFLSAPANAQTTYSVLVDSTPLDLKGIKTGDSIAFATASPDCVCCTISALRAGDQLYFSKVFEVLHAEEERRISVSARGKTNPVSAKTVYPSELTDESHHSRVCFSTSGGFGYHRLQISTLLGSPDENEAETGYDARIQCLSNALYGGFNLNGSELNFLEILSLSNGLWLPDEQPERGDITVHVELEDLATPAASEREANFVEFSTAFTSSLSADRVDVSIHDRMEAGTWGSIKLCHDGAPGSVKASVNRYKITSQNPLEFILVGREPLTRR